MVSFVTPIGLPLNGESRMRYVLFFLFGRSRSSKYAEVRRTRTNFVKVLLKKKKTSISCIQILNVLLNYANEISPFDLIKQTLEDHFPLVRVESGFF